MASGAVAVCIVLVLILQSSAVERAEAQAAGPQAAPMACSQCDQMCNSSCEGAGSEPCSYACGSCQGCMQAYFYRCLPRCGDYCRGASSPRLVACVVVALLLLSSAVEPLEAAAAAPATATKPIRCRKCDHACKKSCKGYGRNSDCSVPCGDPSNKAGCKSCLQAYYSKCLNYCGQACRAVCIN
uniref:Kazal-like domain-containing protein n=1 Tax=Oryza meridionalis TaxID=40149 RepID=A0A0E0D507_9ORYZ